MIEAPGLLLTVAAFLVAIGILVFVHELGHYLAARAFRVRAESFAIGFGREIAGWTDRRGTRWKLGWVPLGGYVRFAGDFNAASLPDPAKAHEPGTFHAAPKWQRVLIVLAGPAINFLAAVLLFMVLIGINGELRAPPVAGTVAAKSAAAAAGFKPGDRITAINGRSMDDFTDIGRYVAMRPGERLQFDVVRAGKPLILHAAPARDILVDRFGNKHDRGLLGIGSPKPERVRHSLIALPGAAVRVTWQTTVAMFDGMGQIITGTRSMKELGGPVAIAKYSGESAALGWMAFLGFMGLLSINLGFINLLPIPTLDGGHLLLYAIESVTRRPVSPAVRDMAFATGFVLLMSLMVFVTFNDLHTFGVWQSITGLIG